MFLSVTFQVSKIFLFSKNKKVRWRQFDVSLPFFSTDKHTHPHPHRQLNGSEYVPFSVPDHTSGPLTMQTTTTTSGLVPSSRCFTCLPFLVVVVVAGFAYSIELDLFGPQLHRTTSAARAAGSGPTRTTRTPSRPPGLQLTLPLLLLLFALPPGLVQF